MSLPQEEVGGLIGRAIDAATEGGGDPLDILFALAVGQGVVLAHLQSAGARLSDTRRITDGLDKVRAAARHALRKGQLEAARG